MSVKSVHPDVNISRWKQEVAVKPDTEYRLSGWIKSENVSTRGAGAHLQAEGIVTHSDTAPERTDVVARTQGIYGTADWQYVETKFRTGREHRNLMVFCGLGDYGAHTTGMAYFDDIRMQEVPTSYLCGLFGNYPGR